MFSVEKLLGEFYPENALEIERLISNYHRAKGSSDYLRSAELIKAYVGLGDIIFYPMGTIYETWKEPIGFNIIKGHLKIVSPIEKYILKDAKLEPIKVVFLSGNSVGVKRLKVIDVGDGEDETNYPQDIEGQAILAMGDLTKVFHNAKRHGASCVLLYYMRAQDPVVQRTPELLPNAVNYVSFPYYANGELFGFSLSYSQYRELAKLAKDGLEIEAELEVDKGTNALQVLEGTIGSSDESLPPILLTAHLCHPKPGANDNASGSALLAEMMKVLSKFDLKRKVVALWVPEMYGTIPYIIDHKPDFYCGINLDMVGENQDITHSTLGVETTPWSLPSFIAELVAVNLETSRFRMQQGYYTGGSDHYIFDDSTVQVPFASLTQWPDRFYHSSEDTVDKSHVASFSWIGEAILKTIYELNFGMPEETFRKVKALLISNYMRDIKNVPLVDNWLSYRLYKSFELLSEFGNTKSEMQFLSSKFDKAKFPQRKNVKNFLGPLGDAWEKETDEDWQRQITRRIPSFGDFLYELLNFLEVGYSIEDSMTIARAEFGIKGNLESEVDYYIRRLKDQGLINL